MSPAPATKKAFTKYIPTVDNVNIVVAVTFGKFPELPLSELKLVALIFPVTCNLLIVSSVVLPIKTLPAPLAIANLLPVVFNFVVPSLTVSITKSALLPFVVTKA